jgi:hypothetical protein
LRSSITRTLGPAINWKTTQPTTTPNKNAFMTQR